jgi:hypothetical protein
MVLESSATKILAHIEAFSSKVIAGSHFGGDDRPSE